MERNMSLLPRWILEVDVAVFTLTHAVKNECAAAICSHQHITQ